MAKEIKCGLEAQQNAVNALGGIANIVGQTLGPGGKTILISKMNSGSAITVSHTKDGFNVLSSLKYVDPIYDSVHKLCLQASGNSVVASGDGSTSSLVMAHAFAKALFVDSKNPQESARKFRREVDRAIEAIKSEAVNTTHASYKVALTSSNGDEELTEKVLEALGHSSAYGTVIVEKNPMQKEKYKIDKEFGYQSGQGYNYYLPIAQSIHETIPNQGEFVLRDCIVVPYNGDILLYSQIGGIIKKINEAVGNSFKLYICAYEISDDVAASVAYMNRRNKDVKIFLSKTTRTAEINGAFQQLNDIAAFSGAQVVDGGSANYWEFKDAGKVGLVRVGPHKTFLLKPSEENWIERRAVENENAARIAPSQMDRDIINSRNASLTGGCVKLIVGGGLGGDIPERADRADDAIRAAQAAMRSGALPGCGASYIRAGQLAGVSSEVQEALSSIHNKIMENYGVEPEKSFEKGEAFFIANDSIQKTADFLHFGVADSYETVESVIRNGFELGLLVANLGGYALEANLADIEQAERTKEVLGALR
jgi:chaperonin GroEL